ncbi:MAG: helix-turn-helix domain-containing protein [Verrucomicrobiia bacterium]
MFTVEQAQRLRAARERRRVTLQELAEMTGYAVSTISSVENGHDQPSAQFLEQITDALGVNHGWLFGGKGSVFTGRKAADFDVVLSPGWIRKASRQVAEFRDRAAELTRKAKALEFQVNESRKELTHAVKIGAISLGRDELPLTDRQPMVDNPPVRYDMPTLMRWLEPVVESVGGQAEFARRLGVSRQSVSAWLSGEKKPDGDKTLQLLNWVEWWRDQRKRPGSVATESSPKTQTERKSDENHNSPSSASG